MAALQITPVSATTRPVDDQTVKLLTDRLLLTEPLTGYADQIMLLTTGGVMGNDEVEIRLVLTAPAFEGFNALHMRFFNHMCAALPPMVDGGWVYEVRTDMHPDVGLPCVTVVINDHNFLGARSTDLILREASVFLEAEANCQYHRVFTLAGNQRLVPLAFQVDDMYRTSIDLTLPLQLELKRPRGILAGVKYDSDSDSDKHGANYLKATLEMALDPFRHVTRIFVVPRDTGEESGLSPRGANIRLVLDYGHDGLRQPTAADLNAIEAVITEVLRRHVQCKTGFFTEPVLVSASTHGDVDDGDYDEDRGWLGEYEEY